MSMEGLNYYTCDEVNDILFGGKNFMRVSLYDSNHNGVVDNAEKVNGKTVECDVPANAKFTDTTLSAGAGIKIENGVISRTIGGLDNGNGGA